MNMFPSPLSPEMWLINLFRTLAACFGGAIRRKSRELEKIVGRNFFLQELERRGYHAIENAGQIVIFCNQEPIRRLL